MINRIMGSKTTMTSGEWSCFISFAWIPLSYSEWGGSEYISPAGFEPMPRHTTTGESAL